MRRLGYVLMLGFCGLVVLVSGVFALIAGMILPGLVFSPALAITLQLDTVEEGQAVEQVADDIERAAFRWSHGNPRVAVVDADSGVIRLEIVTPYLDAMIRLLPEPHNITFQLVEKALGPLGIEDRGNQPVPEGMEIVCAPIMDDKLHEDCYLLGREPVVTGRDFRTARLDAGQFNEPVVVFRFTSDAGERFGRFTRNHTGRLLAVVVNDEVLMAPRIQTEITDSGQIELGPASTLDVHDLLFHIQAAGLPVLKMVKYETTSPTPWFREALLRLLVSATFLGASAFGAAYSFKRLFQREPESAKAPQKFASRNEGFSI